MNISFQIEETALITNLYVIIIIIYIFIVKLKYLLKLYLKV